MRASPSGFLFLALCLAACGGGSTADGGATDAGSDAGHDAGNDAGGDAGNDAALDSGPGCAGAPTVDDDHDGFTEADGDCNDCDPSMNPGAYDFVDLAADGTPLPDAMQVNQSCNGMPPVLPGHVPTCDSALALDDADPIDAAHALGLCETTTASARTPGLISAQYVRVDGSPASSSTQNGILPTFGPNVMPVEGARLLVLSSGHARTPDEPDACAGTGCTGSGPGVAPPGFPIDTPGCSTAATVFDDAALELTLRVPTNASALSFSFSFYAHDYPANVCTPYADQFIALVSPPPLGSINGDVAFDAMANPVSLNAYFPDCDPSAIGSYASNCSTGCPTAPMPYCPGGTSQLVGTGFDVAPAGGATGWLRSTAPVMPGSTITLRLAVWDAGDSNGDSTVLLDDARWVPM